MAAHTMTPSGCATVGTTYFGENLLLPLLIQHLQKVLRGHSNILKEQNPPDFSHWPDFKDFLVRPNDVLLVVGEVFSSKLQPPALVRP